MTSYVEAAEAIRAMGEDGRDMHVYLDGESLILVPVGLAYVGTFRADSLPEELQAAISRARVDKGAA